MEIVFEFEPSEKDLTFLDKSNSMYFMKRGWHNHSLSADTGCMTAKAASFRLYLIGGHQTMRECYEYRSNTQLFISLRDYHNCSRPEYSADRQ